MGVELRDIPCYPHYKASSDGRIWSVRKQQFMKPLNHPGGYHRVNLWENQKKSQEYIHRLVAMAFIPNPNGLPEVNHKDECKTNNAASNLEWCNASYNMAYGTGTSRRAKSKGIGVTNLDTGVTYGSIYEASKATGVSKCTIGLCLRGKRKTSGGYHWTYAEEVK